MNDFRAVLWVKGFETVQRIAFYAMWCFIAWCLMRVSFALAGKQTIAQFGLFLIADLKANTVLSHLVTAIFGALGIGGWIRERNLRRKNIKRLAPRVQSYELQRDPNRTSSGLTEMGTTNPEDIL